MLNKNPSLLNRAVFAQNVDMVKILLEAKADPDAQTPSITGIRPFGGEAWPLRLAVQHGLTDICALLLEYGARLDAPKDHQVINKLGIHSGDDDSGSLLGAAAFKGHCDIIKSS